MLKIKFHTDDLSLQDLVRRYWAKNSLDGWEETVEALSQSTGISKPQIPKLVKSSATAFLDTSRCLTCSNPKTFSSRSDYANHCSSSKFVSRPEGADKGKKSNYFCKICTEKTKNAEFQFQIDQEQKKRNAIITALDEIAQRKFDFSSISFLDAVYCHVIKQASGISSYSPQEIIVPSELFIAYEPEKKTEIFKQLFAKGIVKISKNSNLAAFGIGENGVTYEPSKVVWTFADDKNNFSDDTVSEFIENALSSPNIESLCTLWQQVAQQECEAYFYEVCERWGHTAWSLTKDKQEAISHALKNYSIPQVWNMMYKEAEKLGAQANAGSFNRRHIENMFSGNLCRRSDKWFANSWNVHPWNRRTFEKESYLTSFVFDRVFGGGDSDWENITFSNLQQRATEVVEN